MENMNIVIVGHVDHGKSTIVGRLLSDTGSLPDGKLDAVKKFCELNSRPFEYAFLLDALKDEQAQGITIDAARVFFKTKKRNYIILDAPGHIEFLKNMITGAAKAEAALLVIDAHEGVQENSRRHGYMLSMLGIKQVAVLVNKMDLVQYAEEPFNKIVAEYTAFLDQFNLKPSHFIPVSGFQGQNITVKSEKMAWYKSSPILDVLDGFSKSAPAEQQPFRMPVQDVYKFTNLGDNRRVVAGTIAAGQVSVGDDIVFLPSGKKSKVKSIERFNDAPATTSQKGEAIGFTLEEQIYITRGELAVRKEQKSAQVTTRLKTSIFWLGQEPLRPGKEYFLKLGTSKTTVYLESVLRAINASNLEVEQKETIERHEVGECILKLAKPVAFDLSDEIESTSRFVLVDNYDIAGGGIIREALSDKQSWARDIVHERDYKWEKGKIVPMQRAERYSQRPAMIIITGKKDTGKKTLARMLESQLFSEGKIVYFLGMGNIVYGLDADIREKGKIEMRSEHLRRVAEVGHILLDAGIILILTAIELNQDELELIKTHVNPDFIETVWIGDQITTDISPDIHIPSEIDMERDVSKIKSYLQNNNIIFRPGV